MALDLIDFSDEALRAYVVAESRAGRPQYRLMNGVRFGRRRLTEC